MNNIFKLVLAFLIVSCNKNEVAILQDTTNPEAAINELQNNYDGRVFITTLTGRNNLAGTTHLTAYFKNGENYISVGKFKINETEVPFSKLSNGYDNGISKEPFPSCDFLSGLFGTEISIEIEGNESNGYGNGYDKFQLAPHINSNSDEKLTISRGQGFKVIWTGIQTENSAILFVSSKQLDGSEPLPQYRKSWTSLIDDNGSFIIPWNVLNEFDLNSKLNISIYRFSAGEIECGNKNVSVVALEKHTIGHYLFDKQ